MTLKGKCRKLRDRLEQTTKNWKPADLIYLLKNCFDFMMSRQKHGDVFKHPEHPDLITSVSHHNTLAPVYPRKALKVIETLENRLNQ